MVPKTQNKPYFLTSLSKGVLRDNEHTANEHQDIRHPDSEKHPDTNSSLNDLISASRFTVSDFPYCCCCTKVSKVKLVRCVSFQSSTVSASDSILLAHVGIT